MSLQEKTKTKIHESIALSYSWFEGEFLQKVKEGCVNFWETDFEVKLFSISDYDTIKKDKLSIGEIYFAKPISINSHQNLVFRMSSEFIRTIFHSVLGSSSPTFKLSQLSELEVNIINAFSEFLYKNISQNFVPYDEIPKYALKDKGEYNLTFFVRKAGAKGAKLVISIPKNVLVPNYLSKNREIENKIPDDFSTNVCVRAGTTRLTLNDLKMLSRGDIVLLEKSNVNKMIVKSGEFLYEFKISPDPSLMVDLDEDEHDIGGAGMAKNMWDDIQIEVSAEFDKVKMTLGELKQISSGIVIDLADAFSGKISLVVENKEVARGDLVIINDRYGVKLDQIVEFEKGGQQKQLPPAAQTVETQIKTQSIREVQNDPPAENEDFNEAAEAEEEQFDYSDFEDEE